MREIDEDTSGFTPPYELQAPRRQSAVVPSTWTVGGPSSLVRGEMQKAQVPDASLRKGIDLIKIAFEGMSPLDAQKRGDPTVSPAGFDLARGPHQSQFIGPSFDGLSEEINLFVHRPSESARSLARR
jgi:hypothetical protein